jgi:hypothetical protein
VDEVAPAVSDEIRRGMCLQRGRDWAAPDEKMIWSALAEVEWVTVYWAKRHVRRRRTKK